MLDKPPKEEEKMLERETFYFFENVRGTFFEEKRKGKKRFFQKVQSREI